MSVKFVHVVREKERVTSFSWEREKKWKLCFSVRCAKYQSSSQLLLGRSPITSPKNFLQRLTNTNKYQKHWLWGPIVWPKVSKYDEWMNRLFSLVKNYYEWEHTCTIQLYHQMAHCKMLKYIFIVCTKFDMFPIIIIKVSVLKIIDE